MSLSHNIWIELNYCATQAAGFHHCCLRTVVVSVLHRVPWYCLFALGMYFSLTDSICICLHCFMLLPGSGFMGHIELMRFTSAVTMAMTPDWAFLTSLALQNTNLCEGKGEAQCAILFLNRTTVHYAHQARWNYLDNNQPIYHEILRTFMVPRGSTLEVDICGFGVN